MASSRARSIVLAAILALALIGAVAVGVEAHVKFSNGKWVYRAMTIDGSGDRSAKKDPANLIFKGHNRTYSNSNVRNHIEAHTNLGGIGCGGNQRVVWTKRNSSSTTSDKQDINIGTGGTGSCLSGRWHLRGWDDQEHDIFTSNHGRRNQWTVSAVHHEKLRCCWKHEIDMDWDVARRKMIEKMAGHCSWPKWKHRGGAEGWIQGYYNSGWIGRISLKHTPNC